MSGTVVVKAAPPSTPSTGTTQTQTQTTTTETHTQTQTQTTPAQTETTSAPSETPTTVAPTQTRDVRAPRLRVRASRVVRKLQLAVTLDEPSRIIAVVHRGRARFTVRFIARAGTTHHYVLRPATAGRYRVDVTAIDEAGNRTQPVHVRVRVRR